MSLALAARLARRELRGGLRSLRVFLACLALGVAAIAAVGIVRAAIQTGLSEQGAVLLGGDAQMTFTYRFADAAERAHMGRIATQVSEVVDFRSMAVAGEGDTAERGLTQVRAVDDLWPLIGTPVLDPPMEVAGAVAGAGGLPGAMMDPVLADRLGIAPGDSFRLGLQEFRLMALLIREPDAAAGGFGLGPRTVVATEALADSGLIAPGTLYETRYRMALPATADLTALRAEAEAGFRDAGMRWQDRRRASPGVERFVERTAAFLVLVGLAGMAVGGVGISAAVRSYLDGKIATIATLRSLGAGGRTILMVYLMQIGALTAAGVALGLVMGAALPMALAPVLSAGLPVPAVFAPYPGPLAEAAFYGFTTALLFTLWPLARVSSVRAAALYRETAGRARRFPPLGWVLATLALAAVLVGGAVRFTGAPELALGAAAGIAGVLLVLMLAGAGLRRLARAGARSPLARGRPALRLALGAVGRPGSEVLPVVLSLGLGLSVLAAVGQVEANLRAAIERDVPARAPAFFFIDIQSGQLPGFLARLDAAGGVEEVETAPMLRGILTRINGQPAREVAGNHWVLRGDRGVTYAATPPPGTTITEGAWWPEGYDGPPLVSFGAREAAELGIGLGDRITVNILGRDIEAGIASLREVDFTTGGIGFIMALNPGALAGAPHTHIATVHSEERAEAAILRDIAGAYPNITAIRVRDAMERVAEALGGLAAATALAAGATLLTGFVVLIGAAAAGERARLFEAAVLKTLGATRRRILASFALRSALAGAAAGLVAVGAGAAAGWAVMRFVMDVPFAFATGPALAVVAGGIVAVLAAGAAFAVRPLAARPARVLRAQE